MHAIDPHASLTLTVMALAALALAVLAVGVWRELR